MAAVGKITLDASQYIQQINQVQSITVNATSNMENSAKKFGTAINKAGIATRFVSAEMGQSVVALGRAFQVFAGGKIAIAVAAISAAFVGLKKLIADVTESTDEYNARLDKMAEIRTKDIDSMSDSQKEEDAMLNRLKELSGVENKTAEEQKEQARLTEILADKYRKLHLEINGATGAFADLDDAAKKINAEQNSQKITEYESLFGLNAKRYEPLAENLIKPGRTDTGFRGMQMQNAWNRYSAEDATTQDKIDAVVDLMGMKGATEKELRGWGEILDYLQKQLDIETKLNNLRRSGEESLKAEADALEKASKGSRTQADKEAAEQEAWENQLEKERQLQEEIDKKHGEELQKQLDLEKQIKQTKLEAAQQRRFGTLSGLKFDIMRAMGQGDQAAIQEAIYNETMAQGKPLDPKTISQITQMTKMRLRLDELTSASTAPMDYAPRVNSLIARGGSASPVKMPTVEDLQKRSLTQLQEIVKIAREFNSKVGDWGKVTATY